MAELQAGTTDPYARNLPPVPCAHSSTPSNGPNDEKRLPPDATASGSGASGSSWDQPFEQAKNRKNGRRRYVTSCA
jgi:hypothetical protein